METEIKVGDFVRNKVSGNFGEVIYDPRTIDAPFVCVLVVKPPSTKSKSYWTKTNVEVVKDVHI